MAYTQSDIDTLKSAIAKGAAEVQMNGERVRFDSLAAMKERLQDMEAEVSGRRRSSHLRRHTPRTGRGL